jgi:hypothetical protein
MLRALNARGVRYVLIGNLAGTFHGSPLRTGDADLCPARDSDNLERLAAALRDMAARIRTPDVPAGLAFACDAAFLAQMQMLNLLTLFGDLDLSFEPSGTSGYDDLKRRAVNYDLGEGLIAPVAALEDVIRSKEAANREKDRASLPTLRALLERRRQLETEDPGEPER